MRIGVLGINHKLADLRLRELLAKACSRRFSPGHSLHGEHAFILLSTCNRTEIYFSSEDLTATHSYLLQILRQEVDQEFDHKLYSYFLQDCFNHLARVTAGLDSAIVGETEIQGQVKNAYDSVLRFQTLPADLHYLFQKCLRIGKQVRDKLQVNRGIPELKDAVFTIGTHFFKRSPANILFIGGSEINYKLLRSSRLHSLGELTLCNRTPIEAKTVEGVHILPWHKLPEWVNYDWIILGTKAQEHLIKKKDLPLSFTPKLVVDLSVPRNVDPSLGKIKGITLLNIDQINRTLQFRRKQLENYLLEAESLIAHATGKHFTLFNQRSEKKGLLLCGQGIAAS